MNLYQFYADKLNESPHTSLQRKWCVSEIGLEEVTDFTNNLISVNEKVTYTEPKKIEVVPYPYGFRPQTQEKLRQRGIELVPHTHKN
jgi:hypothetical protein